MPPTWGDPGGVPRGSAVKWVPRGPGAVRNHVKLSFLSTALDPQADVILSQSYEGFKPVFRRKLRFRLPKNRLKKLVFRKIAKKNFFKTPKSRSHSIKPVKKIVNSGFPEFLKLGNDHWCPNGEIFREIGVFRLQGFWGPGAQGPWGPGALGHRDPGAQGPWGPGPWGPWALAYLYAGQH